jgi:hypothetical protein
VIVLTAYLLAETLGSAYSPVSLPATRPSRPHFASHGRSYDFCLISPYGERALLALLSVLRTNMGTTCQSRYSPVFLEIAGGGGSHQRTCLSWNFPC